MKILELSRAHTFSGILLFGLLAMTARNAVDPDLWWHLRTGQWITENRRIPHSDPFSFTRAGQPWVSHEWLSEVVFYKIWRHSGAPGLIVFSAIVTTVGFMLLYRRCPGPPYSAAAATALGALASAPSWGVRPQMFTFAMASLLLWLLERGLERGQDREQDRPWLLVWIPPLFLLWLNLHAGFALGPALMLAYGVGLIFEVASGDTPWQQARPLLLRLLILLLACLALVPLNPSGAQLYRYPLDTLRSAGMRSFIAEWFSPDFHQLLYLSLLVVWLVLLVVLARSRSCPKARVLVPLTMTSIAALDAVRHIPIFVLLAIPVIAAAFSAPSPSRPIPPRTLSSAGRFRPLFNSVAVVLMAVFAVARWEILARGQTAAESRLFPQRAVEVLRSRNLSGQGPVLAYYDWGGYAIFKLYPQYRVFVDGRADLYGDDLLRQFQTAVQLRNGWRNVLDGWSVQAVLLPPYCALTQALLIDGNWHLEYRDSQSALLLRAPLPGENAAVFTYPSPQGEKSATMSTRALQNLRN